MQGFLSLIRGLQACCWSSSVVQAGMPINDKVLAYNPPSFAYPACMANVLACNQGRQKSYTCGK